MKVNPKAKFIYKYFLWVNSYINNSNDNQNDDSLKENCTPYGCILLSESENIISNYFQFRNTLIGNCSAP